MAVETLTPSITRVAEPAPRGPVTGDSAGGNTLPPGGQSAPPAVSVSTEKAIEQINKFLARSESKLIFERDDTTGRTIIKVIDPNTGDIIRQFPPEEIIRMAAMLDVGSFHALDDLA